MAEAAIAPSVTAEQAPAQESQTQETGNSKEQKVASPPPKTTGAATPTTDKINIKLAGKEYAVTKAAVKTLATDLGITEDQFIKDYGTSADATRKTQEAAKLRKEIEADKANIQALFNDLKTDPRTLFKIAKDLGHDPEKLAEELVWEKIQYEKMSPEKRETLEAKRRAEIAEAALKEREESEKKKEAKAFADAAEQEIQQDVLKVLELSKRKADPALIRRVAEIYESYILAKKTKPSHDYVVGKLRDIRRQEFAEDLSGTAIEELVNTLPKDFITNLQSYLVKQARSKDLPTHTPSGSAPSPKVKSKERVTIDEFFKNL